MATKFVLRLHPQQWKVFAGFVFFLPTVVTELFAAAHEWFESNMDEKAAMLA